MHEAAPDFAHQAPDTQPMSSSEVPPTTQDLVSGDMRKALEEAEAVSSDMDNQAHESEPDTVRDPGVVDEAPVTMRSPGNELKDDYI